MKKIFILILILAALGTFAVNFSYADNHEQNPLETCQTMAIEQNIAPEDVEQFITECLASLSEQEQGTYQEEENKPEQE